MSRSGGTYTAPSNSWNPAVAATTIDQDDWNTLLADLEAALTASIAKDGQTPTTAAIPFASGIQTDTVAEKTGNTGVTIDSVLLKDGRVDWTKGANVASASAPDIWTTTGNLVHITGTTQIDDFADAPTGGEFRIVEFDGILTLVHDAAKIDLPGGANITTAAGDRMIVYADSTTLFKVAYTKADGTAVVQTQPVNSIDGTMIAIGSDAVGDILYYDGTDYVVLAAGTDGYHLRANGAAAPTWEDPGTNRIVQVVNSQDGAVATGTTVMPHDDTIPQNTEGDEYMTLAITPTSATNELKIEITVNVSNSAATPTMTAALFQDSTAGALAATGQNVAQTGFEIMTFDHYMTAGTTSSTTFKVRVGGNGAGTTTFNGTSGARKNGGVNASSITITEITV